MKREIEETVWILASGSPRRRELLSQIGVEPQVHPSHVEEQVTSKVPEEVVMELSAQKAEDVAAEWGADGCLILGADTVVAVDDRILGKPASEEEAFEMIRALQGRSHQVYTGVTMIYQQNGSRSGVTFAEKTDVEVFPMTEQEIRDYVSTGDPMDKAGAYGIQGMFAKHIAGIRGDYNNVVGLPVGRVYQEWKALVMQEE